MRDAEKTRRKKKKRKRIEQEKNELMTPNSRVIYPLLEGALEVRDALGAAPEPHLPAEVVPAPPADGALAARDADLEGHAVAHRERPDGHLRADSHHDARGLVAEGQRRAGAQVPVGELLVVRHVRAADPRRLHGDLQLAGAGLLDGPSFLYGFKRCRGQSSMSSYPVI